MVTADELAVRREQIAGSPELQRLFASLTERARPVLERPLHIPEVKALLTTEGGICPVDRVPLAFDPWSPSLHRCPRCGGTYRGERHDRHWARYQHLWLAERAAHLATLAALGDAPAAAGRARAILTEYGERYLGYPNRDNVLGPSRLFFSTYLESLWICNYLAAAVLLREAGQLDESTSAAVARVADEAANLIGDFDEWFSNRQTWNDAALTAIAVWFEDEELAQRAIAGRSGLIAHVAQGFGRDGMWYEGENYHLFALRGLLVGAGWARHAGVDLCANPAVAERLRSALRAPAVSALPDFTYPARKDSRFGVSLAQPAYLELWEIGIARLGTEELLNWLAALYQAPAASAELLESYLHDAPLPSDPRSPSRAMLSWWSLLEMLPTLPVDLAPWAPGSELLADQGLALLRGPRRYVSLECGPGGGGHGHRDRLHLTLHSDGVHWLPDFGTASYVSPNLSWYRSTLAHNAPRLDGRSQATADAVCEAFDTRSEWAWARGRMGEVTRTVVAGPRYLVDLVELASREEHVLELPWHFTGDVVVESPGEWEPGEGSDGAVGALGGPAGRAGPDETADDVVTGPERFVPENVGPVVLEVRRGAERLRAHWFSSGELLRADGPGRPVGGGGVAREPFYVLRARGRGVRVVTVLESVHDAPYVRALRVKGDVVEVETAQGVERHAVQAAGWSVAGATATVRLGGRRQLEAPFHPLLEIDAPTKAHAVALRIDQAPALDGTLAGFDTAEPLTLDVEDQYRRSEEPYPGAEECSARAFVNWTDDALYVAVEVTKPVLSFRAPGAPPLGLDNEPDDIHSDGLQLYLQEGETGDPLGFLIVPEGSGHGPLRVRPVPGTAAGAEMVRGAWEQTERGYRVTVAIAFTPSARAHVGGRMGFDLLVNEMLSGRVRRAGQLVWSGGNGWVWLRGDRQSPERYGVLDLVG